MEEQQTKLNLVQLQKLVQMIANSPEVIFILDNMRDVVLQKEDRSRNDTNFSESVSRCYKVVLTPKPEEGMTDFLKLNCSCVCISEEIIQLTVGNISDDVPLGSYIKNTLQKILGIVIDLPNSLQEIHIKEWLDSKEELFKKNNCLPQLVILRHQYDLTGIELGKTDLASNLKAFSDIVRGFQFRGIIPVIQIGIQYKKCSSLGNTIDLLQKFLGQFIYSLQRSEVRLEEMMLSLPIVGSTFLLKDNSWVDWDSVEKIIFLNHMVWLRTLPPAIPNVIIYDGENLGKQHFIRHCELMNQINKLQLDCPWNRQLCLGKSIYSFLFEDPDSWIPNEKLAWNLFSRRLKVTYDCFNGPLDYKKIIPISAPQ